MRLAGLLSLGIFSPKLAKGLSMLPSTNTNRYGDLLKEFYLGVKNGNLSDTRLDEMQRTFNELWDRESRYKAWLSSDGNPHFSRMYANEAYVGKSPIAGKAVRVKRDNNQAINDSTDTFVQFESAGYDDAQFADLTADNTKITIPETGRYLINFFVRWAANATGVRSAVIQRSTGGGAYSNFAPIDHRSAVSGQISTNAGYDERWLAEGDTLKLQVRQTSTGTLNVINGALLVRQVRTVEYPTELGS